MYHSITFSETIEDKETGTLVGVNTWDDWHLIPVTRPTMAVPKASKNMVEIPGRDGSYDMSDYLTGGITFSDRTGSFQFIVDNGHENWITIYRTIMTYLHGKKLYMCLADDDPGYYYEGRFSVNAWASEAANSKITIDYQVSPYKYAIRTHGADPTIWDTFNFETDDDWDPLAHVELNGSQTITIHGYDYPFTISMLVEEKIAGESIIVNFRGWHETITEVGSVTFPVPVTRGDNQIILSGNGVVSFKFSDGSL